MWRNSLDAAHRASLGDFGLARVCPTDIAAGAGMSTRIFGTPGFIDPEYARSGQVTLASDVYSCGIFALELLSSRRA